MKTADIPLEVIILSIAGLIVLITGVLLFPVASGVLPYYENGLYGLLLVMLALQTIMLGKTPFGDMRRTKLTLAAGTIIASVGIATCFIPDIFSRLPRMLLVLCFGPGSLIMLLRMSLAKDGFRAWINYGPIFRYLVVSCSLVYMMSALVAALIFDQGLLSTRMTAFAVLVYALAIFNLAGVIWKVRRIYPENDFARADAGITADQAMIMLMGIFMLLLGVLLVPVNFGLLPFSGSAQLGLLMVFFAVQMLATGNTAIGPFPRSWAIILLGFLFAAFGVVSCIIPGILLPQLTVFIGVLNIASGSISIAKTLIPILKTPGAQGDPKPPIMRKLFAATLIMNLLAVLFGISMLFSRLLPGFVIGIVLVANGCVLLYLLRILFFLENDRGEVGAGA